MSQAEYHMWKAYRLKRGSLFFGRRIEQSIGGFSALYMSGKGVSDVDPYSFMPHEKSQIEEAISVDDAMEKGLGKLT